MGIENNEEWNFKDLQGMPGNARSLKRNVRACKGILIAPSLILLLEILSPSTSSSIWFATNVGFGPKTRGTDGKPTFIFSAGAVRLSPEHRIRLAAFATIQNSVEGSLGANGNILPYG